MSPFILPQPDQLPCLDKKMGRAIRRLEHLDNIGRNLPQRSMVDNHLGELGGRKRWLRLRCMVRSILLLGEQGIGNSLLLITDGLYHEVSPLLLAGIVEVPGASSPPG